MTHPFIPIEFATIPSREKLLDNAADAFINGNQLRARFSALACDKISQFVIAETRFGCGIAFLLTWTLWQEYAPPLARLHYISAEMQPFTAQDLAQVVTLWPELQTQARALLAVYPVLTPGFHRMSWDSGRVNLLLMLDQPLSAYRELLISGDLVLEPALRAWHVDAWFLDERVADHKPIPCCDALLTTMALLSKKGTTLTANVAERALKDRLEKIGFNVDERASWVPDDKGMVAYFSQLPNRRLPRHTPWHAATPMRSHRKRALVLGAGLAGCHVAHALAMRGWSVILMDRLETVGQAASGNSQAILYPQLSSHQSPVTRFMLSGFLFAARLYRDMLQQDAMGELAGIIQFTDHQSDVGLKAWLDAYPELGQCVSARDASHLAGVTLHAGGLFIPQSGWIDSPWLCQYLAQTSGIDWVPNVTVNALDYQEGLWHAGGHVAEVLVLANGYAAGDFSQTTYFPLQAIHGQMTAIASNAHSASLKIPLCGGGHILPMRSGSHALGATYHPGFTDPICSTRDDVKNLAKIAELPLDPIWSDEIVGHWAGVRGATPDYLPLVGPVANAALFKQYFAEFATDAKRWIPRSAPHFPGLYACTGFGSRGLTSIPLSADYLAALINQEPTSLSRTMSQLLSPARFLRRALMRA